MSDLLVKPYKVTVDGFDPIVYYAASRGKAQAACYRSYTSSWTECTYREFMGISRVRRCPGSEIYGEPIKVAGQDAYAIEYSGQYIRFARPGETETFLSHPADVENLTDSCSA